MFAKEAAIFHLFRVGRFLNADVDFHRPFFEELEYLVEWAGNNDVLIPSALSVCFTYLETVYVVTILRLW